MKTKHIFVVIVCLVACVACQPTLENYRPMIVEGYQWNVVTGPFYRDQGADYFSRVWEIRGESSIKGKNYKQLWCAKKEDKSDALLEGLIREDVSQQKVYLYIDGKDVLLYDFGMKVGQKVKLYLSDYYYEHTEYEYYLQLDAIMNRQDQTTATYREFHYTIYMRTAGAKDDEYIRAGEHITYERFGSPSGIIPHDTNRYSKGVKGEILCAYDENGVVVLTNDESEAEYAGECYYNNMDW